MPQKKNSTDYMFWDKETELGSLDKNKAEKIAIRLCEKDNIKYVDIRLRKKNYDDNVYINTKSGLCLTYDLYKQVKDIIDKNIDDD